MTKTTNTRLKTTQIMRQKSHDQHATGHASRERCAIELRPAPFHGDYNMNTLLWSGCTCRERIDDRSNILKAIMNVNVTLNLEEKLTNHVENVRGIYSRKIKY